MAPPDLPGGRTREARRRALAVEVLRFLTVGGFAYVIDVGLSNFLVFGLTGQGLLADQPLVGKVISSLASMLVAWLGNRLWTYGHRAKGSTRREVSLFLVTNLVGMALALIPLWITWYGLGWRDAVSYNVATNVVGMALAMTFRFLAYRYWVFTVPRPGQR